VDGIIEDPNLCQFRPEALQCAPGITTDCLTGIQVETVRKLLSDYYGLDGSLIYPRLQPGAELADANILFAGNPFPYTTDWFRYAVYSKLCRE
jgi:feruloyl esterase